MVAPVSHSPLTTSDITRLPSSAMINQQGVAPEMAPDQFVPQKKSSKLKKIIFTAIVLAAAAVAINRWKPNWLAIDANNPKWTDHLKNWTKKVATWVETPFKKLVGFFTKKAD